LERSLEEFFGGGGAPSSWCSNKPKLAVIGARRREKGQIYQWSFSGLRRTVRLKTAGFEGRLLPLEDDSWSKTWWRGAPSSWLSKKPKLIFNGSRTEEWRPL
jgi:hypothetical protein